MTTLALIVALIVAAPQQGCSPHSQATMQQRAHEEYKQHKRAAIRINELAGRIRSEADASDQAVYAPDPDHIWNRRRTG